MKDAETIKSQLEQYLNKGAWWEAIETLASVPDVHREAWMDIQLRDLRIKAFKHLVASPIKPQSPCPPLYENPFPQVSGKIPAIDAKSLNVSQLAGAIRFHGALIVRNLINPTEVNDLVSDMDRVFEMSLEKKANQAENYSWYSFPSLLDSDPQIYKNAQFLRDTGSIWTLFSPTIAQKLLSLFQEKGMKSLIRDYFESTPHRSLKKWVLRRMNPLTGLANWHQDGAFMSPDIKSLNLWLALTPCGAGTSSPAMDFIPKRLNEIVPTGSHGAAFKWSISHEYVAEHFPDHPAERPYFNAGDAIFFDHFNLHVTSYSPHFTDRRYAIETWFFAQDSYPENQYPIIW
jgi:hypothetical protein